MILRCLSYLSDAMSLLSLFLSSSFLKPITPAGRRRTYKAHGHMGAACLILVSWWFGFTTVVACRGHRAFLGGLLEITNKITGLMVLMWQKEDSGSTMKIDSCCYSAFAQIIDSLMIGSHTLSSQTQNNFNPKKMETIPTSCTH